MSNQESHQLLQKAAQCYVKAGWLTEACRVWIQIGDYHQAAQTYEQQEQWAEAAQCYRQTKNWSKAAFCYLKDEEVETAAECWIVGGETLKAAWIWVSQLKQVYRTKEALSNFVPQTETQRLEIELITAHCEASTGKKRESAKRLTEQLEPLLNTPLPHLYEWALTISEVINRPDLTALIYATAVRGKIPNAISQWEIWALAKLGDATGVPKEESTTSLKTHEFEVIPVKVFKKVKTIVIEQLEVEPEQVTPEANFVNDLGADSLDIVELVISLEDEFDIEIPDVVAEQIDTVGKAVEHISQEVEAAAWVWS